MKELPQLLKQIYAATCTTCLFLYFGYFIGIYSIMIPRLRSDKNDIQLDLNQESWLMSIGMTTMLPSQLMSGYMSFKFGRKPVMIFCCIPMLIAALLMYLAHSFETLIATCLISGMTGPGFAIGPMYIAEVTSPRYRNLLLNSKPLGIVIGIVLARFLGCFMHWRNLVPVALIPSILGLVTAATSPESPTWVASQKRFEKCVETFKWFRGNNDDEELDKLIQKHKIEGEGVEAKQKDKSKIEGSFNKFVSTVLDQSFIKAMNICVACLFIIDFNGRQVFDNYVIDALTTILNDNASAYYVVIGLDLVNLITAVLACIIAAKKIKIRSVLFQTGFAALFTLAMFCLTSYLFSKDIIPIRFRWLTLVLIIFYFGLLNIGLVPALMCVINEIVPLSHREIGLCLTIIVFNVFSFISVKVTPFLMKNYELHGTFLVTVVIIASSLLYLFFYLPETHNKTLQEIESELRGSSNNRKKADDGCTEVNNVLIETPP